MTTVGRHMALTLWMLAILVIVAFVTLARGPIHDAAWSEDCHTLATGGAIQAPESNHSIIAACRDQQ